MEWLNEVSHVVDQESKSVRFCIALVIWIESVLDVVIHVGVQIVISKFARKPANNVIDSLDKSQVCLFKVIVISSSL